jgi:hypothetical protein
MELGIFYPEGSPELIEGIHHFLAKYHIDVPKPEHEKFSLKLRIKLDQN